MNVRRTLCAAVAVRSPSSRWNVLQGRPVNVKHDARCVMSKVGRKTKDPKGGGILVYYYKIGLLRNSFVTINCSKTYIQRFVGLVICCYLVVTGHCCQPGFHPGVFIGGSPPPKKLRLPKNVCHVGDYNLNIEAKN